jgi:hypothetical protein
MLKRRTSETSEFTSKIVPLDLLSKGRNKYECTIQNIKSVDFGIYESLHECTISYKTSSPLTSEYTRVYTTESAVYEYQSVMEFGSLCSQHQHTFGVEKSYPFSTGELPGMHSHIQFSHVENYLIRVNLSHIMR